MVVGEPTNRLVKKQDVIHIAILLVVALVIGIYLIATAVLIAKDGVSYINYAKGLAVAPLKIICDCSGYAPHEYTPGYPFLILVAHKVASLFSEGSSILTWIYSAQATALFCRVLALIPLYFIGKELVGGKLSFWAILILVLLPYPARFGSDALRDWPHLLFLATGFLLLFLAARYGKWLMFAVVGLVAGFGYMIRPMCAQLLVYGVLWLIFSIFASKCERTMSRAKLVGGLALLVIGFAVVVVPYMKIKGEILPARLRQFMEIFSCSIHSGIQEQSGSNCAAELMPADIAKAFGKLISSISENLMYYFVPALFIGMYYYFRKRPKGELTIFITTFLLVNIIVAAARYCISPQLSKRYILPLITFIVFFVPAGLQIIGGWMDEILCKTIYRGEPSRKGARQWFFILLIIGLGICVPKLFRPLRVEKKGYRLAAEWLKDNSAEEDVIVVPDKRIGFYAGRSGKATLMETDTFLNSSVFSYLAWVKPKGKSIRVIKAGTANDPLFRINADNTLSLIKQNVVSIGTSTGKVTNDVWNHIAVTYDAEGNYKFYINGRLSGEGNHLQAFVFGDAVLGGHWGREFGNGKLGDVLIFNRVLSDVEIAKFYAKHIKREDKIKNLDIWFNPEIKYFVRKQRGEEKNPRGMVERWSGYLNERSKKTKVVIYERI